MAKGYWVARVDVSDPAGYQEYVAANAVAFRKYGARFVVRGGRFEAPEGTARSRNVVLEFKDYETAVACYHSPEYAAAKALRDGRAEADLLIIEGYDGPQPGRIGAKGGSWRRHTPNSRCHPRAKTRGSFHVPTAGRGHPSSVGAWPAREASIFCQCGMPGLGPVMPRTKPSLRGLD